MDFEHYMMEQFSEKYPEVLDDDIPDKFDAWVETLDAGQIWAYAVAAVNEMHKKDIKIVVNANQGISDYKVRAGIAIATKKLRLNKN